MEAEDLVAYHSGEWQIVKKLSKTAPNIRITIFPQTLVIKSVNLGDLSTFVVSAQNGYSIRISYFQGDEERNGLN